MANILKVTTDPQADAIYIYLSNLPVYYTKELDEDRYIDYAADGNIVGVDLLNVSEAVNTEDLPSRQAIERILQGFQIKILEALEIDVEPDEMVVDVVAAQGYLAARGILALPPESPLPEEIIRQAREDSPPA